MDHISEIELIKSCQRGNKADFRGLVERYRNRVFSTAFRIVGNSHDAEDIAQEAFISAYRSIGSFDPDRKFANWLLRIATNLSIDHLRRNKVSAVLTSLDDAEGESGLVEYSGDDPLQAVETSELCGLMEQLITRLPPKYRAAIALYYTEDFTYSEIASTLDIPVGTVKTYLHRGKEMLKKLSRNFLLESAKA